MKHRSTKRRASLSLQYFYWEAIDLVRRIVLTGALLMIRDSAIAMRVVFALLTSLFWLALSFSTYPFKRFELDVLSVISSFTLTCIYIGVLLVQLHGNLQANLAVFIGTPFSSKNVAATVESTFSFKSADSIITMIVVFTFLVITLVFLVLGNRLWGDGQVQTFLLKDNSVPDLTLQKGTFWHLFLSHGEPQVIRTQHGAFCDPLSDVLSSVFEPLPWQSGAAGKIRCRS